MPVLDPKREELVYLAGDQPDPAATLAPDRGLELARGRGYSSTVKMTDRAIGHPLIRYGDKVIEADVYDLPGEGLYIHLICPRCSTPELPHALKIRADHKEIEYQPMLDLENGGRLNVEAFECTWELPMGRRLEFGLGLCRWHVVIENNIARDA